MKKTLCIILILSILSLSACNVAEPIDIPEKIESPSDIRPESPSESKPENISTPIEESSTTPDKTEAEGDITDLPNESTNRDSKESTTTGDSWLAVLYYADDYNEYLKFFDDKKESIPNDFITYDMIKDIGTFDYFYADSIDVYRYTVIDKNEIPITIIIMPALENQVSTGNVIIPDNINNLRNIASSHNGKESVYICDNISYRYLEDGRLYRIDCKWGEKEIWFVRTTGYKPIGDYPLDGETTFVSQLLSVQTAAAAVQSFNQKVEAEIAKNIANKHLES